MKCAGSGTWCGVKQCTRFGADRTASLPGSNDTEGWRSRCADDGRQDTHGASSTQKSDSIWTHTTKGRAPGPMTNSAVLCKFDDTFRRFVQVCESKTESVRCRTVRNGHVGLRNVGRGKTVICSVWGGFKCGTMSQYSGHEAVQAKPVCHWYARQTGALHRCARDKHMENGSEKLDCRSRLPFERYVPDVPCSEG